MPQHEIVCQPGEAAEHRRVTVLLCEYVYVCRYLSGVSRGLCTGCRDVLGVLGAEARPVAVGRAAHT